MKASRSHWCPGGAPLRPAARHCAAKPRQGVSVTGGIRVSYAIRGGATLPFSLRVSWLHFLWSAFRSADHVSRGECHLFERDRGIVNLPASDHKQCRTIGPGHGGSSATGERAISRPGSALGGGVPARGPV